MYRRLRNTRRGHCVSLDSLAALRREGHRRSARTGALLFSQSAVHTIASQADRGKQIGPLQRPQAYSCTSAKNSLPPPAAPPSRMSPASNAGSSISTSSPASEPAPPAHPFFSDRLQQSSARKRPQLPASRKSSS